jgi:hypothetical protein
LVSSDFLDSDYCYDKEMTVAMDRHRSGDAIVIPVILRPCDWTDAPFSGLMATPRDGKPVTKFATLDDAFLEITNEIKRVVKTISPIKQSMPVISSIPAEIGTDMLSTILRSSNLRVAKKFTDHEKDVFLDQAFEYIAKFFEASLMELSVRNPEIKYNYKRIDTLSFSAVIYVSGEKKSECGIYCGGQGGFSKGINYSRSLPLSRNMLNESLNVQSDENTLGLKPAGFNVMNKLEGNLTFEGAADYYWQILMEPLQRNY